MQTKEQLVSGVSLFASFSADELKEAVRLMDEIDVDAGRVLIEEGRTGGECFLARLLQAHTPAVRRLPARDGSIVYRLDDADYALVTIGILMLIIAWASYLWPLVVAPKSAAYPISVQVAV